MQKNKKFLLKNTNVEKPLIVFDFDGVIADSKKIGFELYKNYSKKFFFKKVESYKEFEELFKLSTIKVILKTRIFPLWIPFILTDILKNVDKLIPRVPIFPGIDKTIISLAEKNELIIMTSSHSYLVKKFLEAKKLDIYFNGILSMEGGKSKKYKLLNLKDQRSINNVYKENIIMVTDTTRDVLECKFAGIKVIAVTYGYHSEEDILKTAPDYIVKTPDQIIEAINKYFKSMS